MRRLLPALLLALGLSLLLVAAGRVAEDRPLWRSLETQSLDLRLRIRGAREPSGAVAVVLADDRSVAMLGRWPPSRRRLAETVDALAAAGARLIVLDLLFVEPDADPAADAALAQSIRRAGNVVAAFALTFGDRRPAPAALAGAQFHGLEAPVAPLETLVPDGALAPLEALAGAAAGLGHATIAYDRDGTARHDHAALPFDAEYFPSLAVRSVAAARGVAWDSVVLRLGEGVLIGETLLPTDTGSRWTIDPIGPAGTLPTYALADVLAGTLPAGALARRIAVVGGYATGIKDSFRWPLGDAPIPGAEWQATVIEGMLQGRTLRRPPELGLAELAAPPLLALLSAAALMTLPIAGGVAVALLLAGAYALAAQILVGQGLWLHLAMPLAALLASQIAVVVLRVATVERRRRAVQAAFAQYLAPPLVAALAERPERLRLGGEIRDTTVMFCDIRNFTALSEGRDPEQLVGLLNRFLTPMTAAVLDRRGTVDKYIGDCLMAFWNAPLDDPDHAANACRAALAMLAATRALADRVVAEGGPRIDLGIGLNTGPACVGNLGSAQRFAYSAMGDTVNLASRLEGQCKVYGVPIVLGEAVAAQAPGFAVLELDRVRVKGRTAPVRIFALLGDGTLAATPGFQALAAAHGAMRAAYEAGDWAEARRRLEEARQAAEAAGQTLAPLHALYAKRMAGAVPEGWDGVTVAEAK
ncbi:MAG TPA: adenylate/guanylate cyclase domain-containing protein [Alphaproteobacteria bacterium]|nr:adenylate/guanylate cyclase domain-containing protein [Alphaproteobacteria bacterium]